MDKATGLLGVVYAVPVITMSSSFAGLDGLTFSLAGLGALVAGLDSLVTGLGGSAVGLGGVASGVDVSTCVSGSASGGLASAPGFCGAELSMAISGFSPSFSGVFSGSTSSAGSLVLALLLNRALALQHQKLEYDKPTHEEIT